MSKSYYQCLKEYKLFALLNEINVCLKFHGEFMTILWTEF